jgi:hypothetical protein
MKKKFLLVSLILLYFSSLGFSQEQDSKELSKQERKELKKKEKQIKKEAPPKKGDIYFSPVPVIGVNPASGFIYGIGASTSWFMGNPSTTNLSNMLLGGAFTTKNQTIITFKSNVYTEDNNFILIGDWRFLDSSQPTWGLGTGPQSAKLASQDWEFDDGSHSDGIDEAQMLQFQFVRFYETILKKIGTKGFFAGVGLHLDFFSNITDPLLDLESDPKIISSYYAYNVKNGFNQDKSTLVGLSFNGMYDTRDNQNNPYKGKYAFASFKYNPSFLGSDKSSTTLWLEGRNYWNFTPEDNHNILGLWLLGNFTTSGSLPYMNLPAIGWDQFAKTGRPYAQGRFRGEHLMYSEVEYRKHLYATKNNPMFLGMVAYINATTANGSDNGVDLFEYINPGYGLGLRVNISKKARTNLGIDYGFGSYQTKGLYIRLNETF